MKAIRYISSNLLAAATLAASSADTAYPLANLCDEQISRPFRFAASGEPPYSHWIKIDLGLAMEADCLALLLHNISESAEITLQGNETDSWEDPTLSLSIVWQGGNLYKMFSPCSLRYWRLSISGETVNARIGEQILGRTAAFSQGAAAEYSREDVYPTTALQTVSGKKWIYAQGRRQRNWRLSWNNIGDSTQGELEALFQAVEGNLRPFLFIPDAAAAACHYVRIDPSKLSYPRVRNYGGNLWTTTLQLMEEVGGEEVT